MENWDLHVSFSDSEEDPVIMANIQSSLSDSTSPSDIIRPTTDSDTVNDSASRSVTVAESRNQIHTNVSTTTTVVQPSLPPVSETTPAAHLTFNKNGT